LLLSIIEPKFSKEYADIVADVISLVRPVNITTRLSLKSSVIFGEPVGVRY
jgi:hypothetical protein